MKAKAIYIAVAVTVLSGCTPPAREFIPYGEDMQYERMTGRLYDMDGQYLGRQIHFENDFNPQK